MQHCADMLQMKHFIMHADTAVHECLRLSCTTEQMITKTFTTKEEKGPLKEMEI